MESIKELLTKKSEDLETATTSEGSTLSTVEAAIKEFPYYQGTVTILNSLDSPFQKIGDIYIPKDEKDIELLEYQVSVGMITKVTE
jgi:hypothetical protein